MTAFYDAGANKQAARPAEIGAAAACFNPKPL
jgi:hypothetical protein